jgi:hypothetical protein
MSGCNVAHTQPVRQGSRTSHRPLNNQQHRGKTARKHESQNSGEGCGSSRSGITPAGGVDSSRSSSSRTHGPVTSTMSPTALPTVSSYPDYANESSSVVLAAVEGIRCSLWVNEGAPFLDTWCPAHVLACIRCICTLTRVAPAMAREGTSKSHICWQLSDLQGSVS